MNPVDFGKTAPRFGVALPVGVWLYARVRSRLCVGLNLPRVVTALGSAGVDLVIMPVGKSYYELRFAEAPDVIQGYIHSVRTINRINKGERAGIEVDPETLWVRKIWPLDRKLKWYQF